MISKNSVTKQLPVLLVSLLLILLASFPLNAGVIAPDLEKILQVSGPDKEIPVIITLSDKVDFSMFNKTNKNLLRARIIKELKSKAESSQISLRTFLEHKGSKKLKSFWIMNGIAVTVREEVIQELEKQAGVEEIRIDAMVFAPQVTYGFSTIPEWNLETIRAPEIWDRGYKGAGTVVASMDTGVDINHPDLKGKWRGGGNSWYDPSGEHDTPHDSNGHGTQTMGVIIGGDAGGTAIGIAPNAQWIAVKIFNDSGRSYLSAIHQGFQWLLDPDGNPDTDDAPDIVNNSWGLDNVNGCSLEFQSDIQALKAANIAVVFSAGNSGPNSSTSISPANNPVSFAVGAIDLSLNIALFSSRGPSVCDGDIYPEIVAPGVNIKTSDLTAGGIFPNSYVTVSGTSFSSAHVTGAMALLLSAFPDLTVDELESAIRRSAHDFGIPNSDNAYGYGLIDLIGAYDLLVNLAPEINVLPTSYDFGIVKVGKSSSPQVFTVRNNGMTELITGETSITGPNSTEFKIVDDMCSGNIVNPLSTCSVAIVLSPSSEGIKRANLSIPSNDPDENPFYVNLMGTAARVIINAPSSLRALGVFRYSVILSWKDNSAIERGFYIERSTDAGKTWTRVGQTARSVTYYWDRFLTRSTKYWYRIQAFNAAGLSQYSNVASTTTR